MERPANARMGEAGRRARSIGRGEDAGWDRWRVGRWTRRLGLVLVALCVLATAGCPGPRGTAPATPPEPALAGLVSRLAETPTPTPTRAPTRGARTPRVIAAGGAPATPVTRAPTATSTAGARGLARATVGAGWRTAQVTGAADPAAARRYFQAGRELLGQLEAAEAELQALPAGPGSPEWSERVGAIEARKLEILRQMRELEAPPGLE